MINPPRALTPAEIDALLTLDVPARLATVDSHGLPHVTPLSFLWEDGAFHLTSYPDRPHLRRLERNPRVGLCVDVEVTERAVGYAELFTDPDGAWTRRIDEKCVRGPAAAAHLAARAGLERTVIQIRPTRLVAVASV